MSKKTIIISSIAVVIAVAAFVVYNTAVAPKPDDNANVKPLRAENLMGTQYTEILPVWGNAITEELIAGVYNTATLNDPNKTGNTSPDEMVAKIDLDKVKKECNALKVILNGPRIWTVDWVEVNTGKIRDFDGLDAYWVMWFHVPKGFKGGETSYQRMEGERDTHMGIKAGSAAIILDDPDGTSWVMKSMGRVKYPDQKFSNLSNLGSKLTLPADWKWRYVILEKELVFQPDNGKAWITQDDMGNTYDRVGGNFSNYKP